MTKDEALKLALETLEFANVNHWWGSSNIEKAITAIKEALAQPEQPKVRTGDCLLVGVCASEGHKIAPQRTWVGLTRTELIRCGVLPFGMSYELYEAIEQALKERNT